MKLFFGPHIAYILKYDNKYASHTYLSKNTMNCKLKGTLVFRKEPRMF